MITINIIGSSKSLIRGLAARTFPGETLANIFFTTCAPISTSSDFSASVCLPLFKSLLEPS